MGNLISSTCNSNNQNTNITGTDTYTDTSIKTSISNITYNSKHTQEEITKEFIINLAEQLTLDITTFNGIINVKNNINNTNNTIISILKYANNKTHLKDIICDITQQPTSIIINAKCNKSIQNNIGVDIDITTSTNTSLILKTSNGDIIISGSYLDINATTSNSKIILDTSSNKLNLHSSNGTIKIENSIPTNVIAKTSNSNIYFSGYLQLDSNNILSTSNGSITCSLKSPEQPVSCQANTSNGAVYPKMSTLDRVLNIKRLDEQTNFTGVYNKGDTKNCNLKLHTSNGNIYLSNI